MGAPTKLHGNKAPQLFTVQLSARDYDTLQVALGIWNHIQRPTPLQLQEASIHSGGYLSDCYFGEYDTVSGLQQRLKRQIEPQLHVASDLAGPEVVNKPATDTQRGIDVGAFEEDEDNDIIVGEETDLPGLGEPAPAPIVSTDSASVVAAADC